MKSGSRYKHSRYLFLTVAIAAALAGCSKGAQDNRRIGQNANLPVPGTVPVGPNGIYMLDNIPCNINDMNSQSMTSPYNQQSPCNNNNILAQQLHQLPQQQIVNQVPGGQPQLAPGQIPPQQQQQGLINSPYYGVPQTNDDIPRDTKTVGRIVDKQIQLASGIGIQDTSDTCAINKDNLDPEDASQIETVNGVNKYHYARFLTPPNVVVGRRDLDTSSPSDRFDFWFDHVGALRISAQSYVMQAATSQLIHPVDYDASNPPREGEYALDPDTRTLHVGPFSMTGPLSDLFIKHERFLAAVLKHDKDLEDKDTYSINSDVPEFASQSYQGGQGQQTFVVRQAASPNSNSNSSSNFSFRPQGGGTVHPTSPSFVTMDIGPVVAKIGLLLPINPQHITGLFVDQVQWHAHIYVDTTSGLNQCTSDADGHFVNMYLK